MKNYRKYIFIVVVLTFFDVMTGLYLPNLMSKIVNNGIIVGDYKYIVSVGLKMLVLAVLASISMVSSSYFSARATMGFSRDIREDVFSHVSSFSLEEFNRIGTSSLITRTTNDINQLQQVFLMSMRMMLRAPLMLFGGLIMAFTNNPRLSILILIAMPILVVTVYLVGRKGFPLFGQVQESIDGLNLILREKLTGVRVIRAFDRVDYERERFGQASRSLSDISLKVDRIMLVLFPLINLILNFTIIGVIWFGAREVDLGNMFIGDIMAFIQYVMLSMFSIVMFSVIFVVVPRAVASNRRIQELMDIEPSLLDRPGAQDLDSIDSLEFRDVVFSYPHAERDVLCKINFSLKAGESLAIIGGTGSGKTSLVNLIPRFYDVSGGSILINGRDIRDYRQEDLRQRIGFVAQKSMLFSGSIKDNILRGREGASQEELRQAADIAQARDFIEGLEAGYNSVVAQGATNFSGGQKQRLSIARAIIRQADLYIFDDSFSALDAQTDARLRMRLNEELAGAMKIIVAQRVSSVMDADRILVLDDGLMVGYGSHRELVKDNKVYREIVKSQLPEEEI